MTDISFTGGQMNLTLIGDFYADFGLFGIIIGMFILGIVIHKIYNNFLKRKNLIYLFISLLPTNRWIHCLATAHSLINA